MLLKENENFYETVKEAREERINYFDTPNQRRERGNRTTDLVNWIVVGKPVPDIIEKETLATEQGIEDLI